MRCTRGSEFRHWDEDKGVTASLRLIKGSSLETRKLFENDILVEISGGGPEQPVGRTVLIDKSCLSHNPDISKIGTNFLRLIRPSGFVSSKYLNHYLQFFYKSGEITKYQAGSNNLRNLKFKDYVQIEIPFSPLNEQHRIVAKIEELFSELDNAIESLNTARQQLKVYRQALLKHAFEGKLTAQWRKDHANKLETADDVQGRTSAAGAGRAGAAELLARIQHQRQVRYQQQLDAWQAKVKHWQAEGKGGKKPGKPKKSIFKKDENLTNNDFLPTLPLEWRWLQLGECDTEIFDGPLGSNLKTSDYVENGVRVIRLENIGVLEFIDGKVSYISEEKYELLRKHTVVAGDIIFSSFVIERIRVAVVPDNIDKAINKADCFCVRVHGETLNNVYWASFLSTRLTFKQIEELVHGVGRSRINTAQLKNIWIPLCFYEEQKMIVQKLEEQLSEISVLESDIKTSLQRAEALRQSILKKAFSGQLVVQDPNEEPASGLLQRIQAQKAELAAQAVAKKTASKKKTVGRQKTTAKKRGKAA